MGVLAAALFLFAWLYRFNDPNGSFAGLTDDHFFYLVRGWQLLFGDLPVRDFVDHGAPLYYYVAAAVQTPHGARHALGVAVLRDRPRGVCVGDVLARGARVGVDRGGSHGRRVPHPARAALLQLPEAPGLRGGHPAPVAVRGSPHGRPDVLAGARDRDRLPVPPRPWRVRGGGDGGAAGADGAAAVGRSAPARRRVRRASCARCSRRTCCSCSSMAASCPTSSRPRRGPSAIATGHRSCGQVCSTTPTASPTRRNHRVW